MNIIFMGTPEFAETILKSLINEHNVLVVVTQPDKPTGRGHKMRPPPVKVLAESAGITVLQPKKLRDDAFLEELKSYNPDLIVVAAYGRILPKAVLDLSPHGCINVHPSLLPRYRGAAPIQQAIINGDIGSGVTIMQMDEGLDTGKMILKTFTHIEPDDTYGTLHDRLAVIGGEALLESIRRLEDGTAFFEPQIDANSCYAPMITNELCLIDWYKSDAQIVNLIRALNPLPGAFSPVLGLKIWRAVSCVCDQAHIDVPPGEVIGANKNGLIVRTADDAILITEMQAKGGKKMSAADFLRGNKIPVGSKI